MLESLPAAKGFAHFRVAGKVRESASITSFLLQPLGAGAPLRYRPGQFVVLRIPRDGAAPLLRAYSLSGDPDDGAGLRISVKHETAPAHLPEAPAGQGSSFLHERVEVGGQLEVAGPSGDFVLDEDSPRPVLLFSGGVGLTPMVSMLHRLASRSSRPVYFVHACENGAVHALRDEVLALAARRAGIRLHFCYRTPSAEDLAQGRCHSSGLVSRETLQALLPLDDYDVYLCGPRAFMQANWRLLCGLGIERSRIRYEFFGPATILDEDESPPAAEVSPPPAQAAGQDGAAPSVRFHPQAPALAWDEGCRSLLELAEKAGLAPPFSCRAGLCNACQTPLLSGTVEYPEAPLSEPPPGQVLLCCARPTSALVLALDDAQPTAARGA